MWISESRKMISIHNTEACFRGVNNFSTFHDKLLLFRKKYLRMLILIRKSRFLLPFFSFAVSERDFFPPWYFCIFLNGMFSPQTCDTARVSHVNGIKVAVSDLTPHKRRATRWTWSFILQGRSPLFTLHLSLTLTKPESSKYFTWVSEPRHKY